MILGQKFSSSSWFYFAILFLFSLSLFPPFFFPYFISLYFFHPSFDLLFLLLPHVAFIWNSQKILKNYQKGGRTLSLKKVFDVLFSSFLHWFNVETRNPFPSFHSLPFDSSWLLSFPHFHDPSSCSIQNIHLTVGQTLFTHFRTKSEERKRDGEKEKKEMERRGKKRKEEDRRGMFANHRYKVWTLHHFQFKTV